MRRVLLLLAALLILTGAAKADIIPPYAGFVTDAAGLLDAAQRQALEAELRGYERQTGTEIAILIVKDTGGLSAWEYATNAGNQWGVGKKGIDNGALILVAVGSRDFWIATGRQLEGAVTDAEAGAIFRNLVRPRFRQGDYFGGLKAAVQGLKEAAAGETFTDERMGQGTNGRRGEDVWNLISLAFVGGIVLISWLGAILGRSKAWWPGGVIGAGGGAGIALIFGITVLWGLALAAALGIAGLAFDYVVSKNYRSFRGGGPRPPWYMGGGGFYGGRRGGGGFGGFGGGGFSGGGGGGRW